MNMNLLLRKVRLYPESRWWQQDAKYHLRHLSLSLSPSIYPPLSISLLRQKKISYTRQQHTS